MCRSIWGCTSISIHAPRVGSDPKFWYSGNIQLAISIHAPRVGSDIRRPKRLKPYAAFLSTLPAWGATGGHGPAYLGHPHFYPRSPRGERPMNWQKKAAMQKISIHAPRVGSDR